MYLSNKWKEEKQKMAVLNSVEGDRWSLSHSIDIEPRDSDFPSHIHDNYEIFCLVRGKVDYIVEGRLYKLRAGSIMLMRPSETHKLVVNKSTEYERYVLNFSGSLFNQAYPSRELLSPFKKRALGEKNMYLANELGAISPVVHLEKMMTECLYFNKNDALISNLASLLCSINLAFNKKGTEEKSPELESEIISFVNENLTSELTIEKIAQHAHISPSQVSRIFKKATGKSPHSYITAKRLILFNKKLKGGIGVIDACHECGFHDYSAFYRLYKKHFGKAPTEY